MKNSISIFLVSFFVILATAICAQASEIRYNREAARIYASQFCGAQNYNPDYTCYNGDLEACVKDNPWLKNGCKDTAGNVVNCKVDCANFASQALIGGGFNFNNVSGAVTIGKGGKAGTKGFISVNELKTTLMNEACYEITTDPSKAKPGDLLSFRDSSHVVIYAGDNKYYSHTTDRCGSSGYVLPENLWNNVNIYHFQNDDICKKCEKTGLFARLVPRCDKCSTCDSSKLDPCISTCDENGSGRCASYKRCVTIGDFSTCMSFGPGGDCPDDTFTNGMSVPPINEAVYPSLISPAGILENGYSHDTLRVLKAFRRDARFVKIDELSPTLVQEMPLLIIPTAGLEGIWDSEFFKASLNEYIAKGGTVVVLAQKYGYFYSVLPGGLSGYGWQEDQSCQANSSYIDTWHPLLAGQTRTTPSLNIDGYFTGHPADAAVLLRRVINGQPVLITYTYGSGRVIAATAFTDYAYTSNQASVDEMRLLRDIVSWAARPESLPEIRPGETINLNILIANHDSTKTATAVELKVYDPDKKVEKESIKIPVTLAPGQSTQVPVAVTTSPTDPLGIYIVEYSLLTEGYQLLTSELVPEGINTWVEYLLQPSIEEPSGRFAVSSPPTEVTQAKPLTMSITASTEYYFSGQEGTFTWHVWNNSTAERTVTVRYGFPHHAMKDGTYGSFPNYSKTLTIAPQSEVTFTHAITIATEDRAHSYLYDESNNLLKDAYFKIWLLEPSTAVNITTDKSAYAKGEAVNLTVDMQNKLNAGYGASLNIKVTDPSNALVYSETRAVALASAGALSQSAAFTLAQTSKPGFYAIYAEVFDSNGKKIGGDTSSFEVPGYMLTVAPVLPSVYGVSNNISLRVENRGFLAVASASLSASLTGPDGAVVWSGQMQGQALQPGQSVTYDFPVSIQNIMFGDYRLSYTLSYEGGALRGEKIIPNTASIAVALDKPSYRMREQANLTLTLTNTGRFNLDNVSVTVNMPDAGYTDTSAVSLPVAGSLTSQASFVIPANILSGQHDVNVILTLPSGNSMVEGVKLTVPDPELSIGYAGPSALNAGDVISLTVSNAGGVDTGYTTEMLTITDKNGIVVYSGGLTGALLAGEGKLLADVNVPAQTISGTVYLYIKLRDNATGKFAYFHKPFEISGVSAALAARTDKDVYLTTEQITGQTSVTNGPVGIEGGTLTVTVTSERPSLSQFRAFAGGYGSGDGQFNSPFSLASDYPYLYVTDRMNNRIQKFDINGNFIGKWGSYGTGSGQFDRPLFLDISADGFVYVSEPWNNRVQKFDGNGNFIAQLSGFTGHPRGVAAYSSFIFVADGWCGCVRKFDSNGNLLSQIGTNGSGNGQLSEPHGVAAGPDGSIYVADTFNYRVHKFDQNGTFIAKWGSNGSADGQFIYPTGISVGPDSAVYVTDSGTNRIQKFDGNGNFLAKWAGTGTGDGQFQQPQGIEAASDGTVYVADAGNNRIQKLMASTGGHATLFETTSSVSQSAGTLHEYITNIGALNAAGKLYLGAVLKNSLGQVISTSEYPFYVVSGNTVLMFNSDKKIYKPGETVAITGAVRNLAAVSLDNAALSLVSGVDTLINQTITVPAGGSYPFTATTTAGSDGMVTLTGSVMQNTTALAEVSDWFEVSSPALLTTITAPDVIGRSQFDLNVKVKNTGKADASVTVTAAGGQLYDGSSMTIPAGQTRLLQYAQQITQTTAYTVSITGDAAATAMKTVTYGEAAQISFGANVAYPVGLTSVPVVITNTGQMDEQIDVTYQLIHESGAAAYETRSYFIPQGAALNDTLNYDITKGGYILSASSPAPSASALTAFTAALENDVAAGVVIGAETAGIMPVWANITNNGWNAIEGAVVATALDSNGKVVWSSEVSIDQLLSRNSTQAGFSIDPGVLAPGVYQVKVVVYDTAGTELAVSAATMMVTSPVFTVAVPPYQTFSAGQSGSLTFSIRNTGTQEGELVFAVRSMDILDSTVADWLKPGEERVYTFDLLLPDDLEEKDYSADYSIKGGVNGQVKFHVTGMRMSVSALLDRQSYNAGDTAALTLDVIDNRVSSAPPPPPGSPPGGAASNPDIALFARVKYAGYEETRQFTLGTSTSVSLAFNVPLASITGEKLFYGIYYNSGRSIHLNSLYVYETGALINIATDRQVYNPGETVLISVTGSIAGTITLEGPGGFVDTFAFSGSASRPLTLPSAMTAGTYHISYSLTDANSNVSSGSRPFDIAGIQVKVKEASLDKPKYASSDTINLNLTVESNTTLPAMVKTWVITPDGNYTAAGSRGVNLSSSENIIVTHSASYTTASSGIHRFIYGIYDNSDMLLSSGSEAFDVGDAVMLGLSTDKVDYATNTEAVNVTASLYGTTGATLELYLDGRLVATESLNLAGFFTYNSQVPVASAGAHTFKAILNSGGLTSVKETSFVYGSGLPDLVMSMTSDTSLLTLSMAKINLTVANHGKSASVFTVAAVYDNDPSAGGMLIGTVNIGPINQGESVSTVLDWNVMGYAGSRTIYGMVDPSNSVVEFDETNNSSTATVMIPDVTLTALMAETSYSAGEEILIDGYIANLNPAVTYTGVQVVTSIVDSIGAEVFRDTKTAELLPMSMVNSFARWDTTGQPLGTYAVTMSLVYNQQIIAGARLNLSLINTVPVISLLSPSGGETITGSYPVAWQATDHDGNVLTLDISYSNDGGLNWVYLADNEANDGSYLWDTAALPDGQNYQVRITAKDGIATASAQSGTFALLNSGALKINSVPSGAKVYLGGNYGYLGAYAGVTGINIAAIKAGRHVIRLNYPGYNVYYQMVDIIVGQEAIIMANLTPITSPFYTNGSRIYSLGALLDAGSYSAPFAVDWNMDGRKDLIIGNGDGQVLYYENTGTDNNPSFGLTPATILTASRYIYPFVIDWDNDGKTDIVAGNTYGETVLFRNISTGAQPAFDSGAVVAKVNDSAVPFVIDWNEDGRKDLVVGSGDGTLNLFLNSGTDFQPSFNPAPDYIPLVYGNNMAPFVATDWDADGKKDLLIGSSNGNLLLYLNSGTNISPVFGTAQPVMGAAGPLNVVSNSIPFATDWNNDGLTDILAGNSSGEVYLFTGNPSLVTVKIEIEPETLNMNSKGQWVTCKIELPSGYNPEDLVVSSLLLQGVIPAETQSVEAGHEEDDDHEADEVKVKFDRQRLQGLLTPGEHVKVFLTGRLRDGRNVKGEDTIKVIDKDEKEKHDG